MLGNAAHTGRAPAFAPVLPRPAATHRERVPMRRLPQIWLRRRLFSLRRLSTGWLGRGVRSDIERCIFGFVWGVQSLDRVAWPRCPLRHREVFFGFSWGVQSLDRMAWPSCPPKYGGVFFRFCLGCAIASIGRPNLLDMSVPKNTPGTVTATVPDTNHLRPLRQASGGAPLPAALGRSPARPRIRGRRGCANPRASHASVAFYAFLPPPVRRSTAEQAGDPIPDPREETGGLLRLGVRVGRRSG